MPGWATDRRWWITCYDCGEQCRDHVALQKHLGTHKSRPQEGALTISEAAKSLGVCYNQVKRWRIAGKLIGFEADGKVWFTGDSLRDFASKRIKRKPEAAVSWVNGEGLK